MVCTIEIYITEYYVTTYHTLASVDIVRIHYPRYTCPSYRNRYWVCRRIVVGVLLDSVMIEYEENGKGLTVPGPSASSGD